MSSSSVVVFGSSEPQPGSPAYREARIVGKLLAAAGHAVVTGGYGGVMEAASRGARDAGGRAIGVTCELFSSRRPNPYLTEVFPTPDLYVRTRELIDRGDAFVVLPGKAGTLAELSMLWALDRAGCLGERPVVLLGSGFARLLEQLEREKMLDRQQLERCRVAATPEEVVERIAGWQG